MSFLNPLSVTHKNMHCKRDKSRFSKTLQWMKCKWISNMRMIIPDVNVHFVLAPAAKWGLCWIRCAYRFVWLLDQGRVIRAWLHIAVIHPDAIYSNHDKIEMGCWWLRWPIRLLLWWIICGWIGGMMCCSLCRGHCGILQVFGRSMFRTCNGL